jgi:hypothetical protein
VLWKEINLVWNLILTLKVALREASFFPSHPCHVSQYTLLTLFELSSWSFHKIVKTDKRTQNSKIKWFLRKILKDI